jgi:ABC-type multidrug transport system permease subunit
VISWWKLFLTILVDSFFSGCFTFILLGFVKKPERVQSMFTRIMFPLWFFGGFQFSWKVLYNLNPWLSYVNLLNPYIYSTEAARVSLLGPDGFLPFFLCIFVLLFAGALGGAYGYKRTKKYLDLA